MPMRTEKKAIRYKVDSEDLLVVDEDSLYREMKEQH
jgi:hypothetical protein